jgi:hypothetical protein
MLSGNNPLVLIRFLERRVLMDFAVRLHTGINHPDSDMSWHRYPMWTTWLRHVPPVSNNDRGTAPSI